MEKIISPILYCGQTCVCSATLIHFGLRCENKLTEYQFEGFRLWND